MLIIIITVLGVGIFHKQLFGVIHIRKSIACNATVILKDIWGGGEHKGAFIGKKFYPKLVPGYRLTFESSNLNTVSLIVPKKIYDSVSVGSVGFLECTGKNFAKFTLGKNIDKQEKLSYEMPKNKFDFRI